MVWRKKYKVYQEMIINHNRKGGKNREKQGKAGKSREKQGK
jgi:hypothetical protein